MLTFSVFFFQAEDGIRDLVRSRGLGDVYKRQGYGGHVVNVAQEITTFAATLPRLAADVPIIILRREGQEPGQRKDLHVRSCLLYTSDAADE